MERPRMSESRPTDLLSVTMDVNEAQFDALVSDRPWSPLPADLEQLIEQLPTTEERCNRTAILIWAHRHQGLIGYSQVYRSLTGYKDLNAGRKHASSLLLMMVRQGLLKQMHFGVDAPRHSPAGLNEGTAFEMTGAGLIYLRGAMLARQNLARRVSLGYAHEIISAEEDDGRSHEVHYLASVTVRDASGTASATRSTRLLNSVFSLAG